MSTWNAFCFLFFVDQLHPAQRICNLGIGCTCRSVLICLKWPTVRLIIWHEPSSSVRTLGSWIRIQIEAGNVCVYSFCVVLCVGSGLATS
jgi:hypothetical protein